MAFEMIDLYRLYTCESTDIKKTDNIQNGSILKETDTGFSYIFNGTSWVYSPQSVQISDGVNVANVIATNGNYGIVTISPSHISTTNSSTDVLDADEVFTGTAEDTVIYVIAMVTVYSDVASAIDGLCIEISNDNISWRLKDCYTIYANEAKVFSVQCPAKYLRVKYTNGSTPQIIFDLSLKLFTTNAIASSHRIGDTISPEDDAELIKAVLTAQRTNDNMFVPITASKSNNLRITDAESSLAIAKGEVTGSEDVNKWGNAPNFATSDGEIDIWDAADSGTAWELMNYIYPTGATIDSVSSSNATDTNTVRLVGLDADGLEVEQTITLNGQTRVALTTNLYRFYRGYNDNGTEFLGHVIIYENTPLTAGVPTLKTKIKGVISPAEQQTEMALYTIPADKTGYLLGGYCSTAGANKDSNYIIKFKIRELNGVFRTQQKISISDNATSFLQFDYSVPQKLESLTDIKVTALMALTNGNNASVSAGFGIILIEN